MMCTIFLPEGFKNIISSSICDNTWLFFWGYIDSILKSVSTKAIFYFGIFCFFLLQIYLSLGFIANPYLIWFLWGIFGTSASLTFAILSKSYPPEFQVE